MKKETREIHYTKLFRHACLETSTVPWNTYSMRLVYKYSAMQIASLFIHVLYWDMQVHRTISIRNPQRPSRESTSKICESWNVIERKTCNLFIHNRSGPTSTVTRTVTDNGLDTKCNWVRIFKFTFVYKVWTNHFK